MNKYIDDDDDIGQSILGDVIIGRLWSEKMTSPSTDYPAEKQHLFKGPKTNQDKLPRPV